jgi:hypothetical protein
MVINLLSSPRNVSTAFMYSFARRDDTKVIDEPFYAYYLSRRPVDHPGRAEVLRSMPTELKEILRGIHAQQPKHPVIFLKNMAHHLVDTDARFILEFTNVFLIRNPRQLITSFAKVITNPTMDDIGVVRQHELFNLVETQSGQRPVVIDSGELLKSPESVLKQLCARLDIPFDQQMLSWPPGPIPEDGVWARYWYDNVHQSTGFARPSATQSSLPDHCVPLYESALPHYEALYAHSIKAEP